MLSRISVFAMSLAVALLMLILYEFIYCECFHIRSFDI